MPHTGFFDHMQPENSKLLKTSCYEYICVAKATAVNLVEFWGMERWIQKAWLGARSGVCGGDIL